MPPVRRGSAFFVRLHDTFDFMTIQSLSKQSKNLKIVTGVLQILFGIIGVSFGVFLGIYFVDGHLNGIEVGIWSWLVVTSLYCAGRGIKLIYDSRRAA